MSTTVYSSNDHFDDDAFEDGDQLEREFMELKGRVEVAEAIHGHATPELIEEMTSMLSRLERHKKQIEEERAGLNALKAAFRPGENLGQLLEWGKAQGLTTMQEIFDARAAENETSLPGSGKEVLPIDEAAQ